MKFHNGREVTAEDVEYTLDRTTDPKTQSPGAGFYKSIKGYDDVAGSKADHLAGVTVVDPYTVKIELSKPDAPFLHELALNFASIVAKEDVEKWGADYGKHPDGSGPYYLSDWTLGQQLVFERNKDYYVPGVPLLDKIVFEIGQEPLVALLRLQKGEVDLVGDGIPPAKFLEVMNDPEQRKMVYFGPQLQTGYVTMNVQMKPFDDVRVRQAVNMAINKERVVKIHQRPRRSGEPAAASRQCRASTIGHKGYAYEPERAKQLLAEAGHPRWLRDRALRLQT